jgi:dipeptidyl aminopeptidase/acylaminoacyl peptidase
MKPLKAKLANQWLVERMSASESPNLFITTDFINFRPVSQVYPERGFNWLTSTLINWQVDSNIKSQGILYKPENFDSTKKYPIIFTYYEKRSDGLNNYLAPAYCENRLDIPTYVSQGYLVFVPDMQVKQGHNGIGAVNTVRSAVDYLKTLPYVNVQKMGLQGHSFGGWVTNYLVTQLDLFAAASEIAGASDLVSGYDQLYGLGQSRQELYEVNLQGSPFGVGNTPWTKRDLYIENSPVFFVEKIKTPLLMVHGEKDPSVSFEQAMELFLAMKRAGKKVWLLDYPDSYHAINGKNSPDYTIRLQQFFDHYLKNMPSPSWMENGIPARMKSTELGYELLNK